MYSNFMFGVIHKSVCAPFTISNCLSHCFLKRTKFECVSEKAYSYGGNILQVDYMYPKHVVHYVHVTKYNTPGFCLSGEHLPPPHLIFIYPPGNLKLLSIEQGIIVVSPSPPPPHPPHPPIPPSPHPPPRFYCHLENFQMKPSTQIVNLEEDLI